MAAVGAGMSRQLMNVRAEQRHRAGDAQTRGVIVGKNVAVFVDVANIFYAAKAAGVDIDYVTLLKSATAGRDFVRAYAYTGLDPDNENQRNFHDFLAPQPATRSSARTSASTATARSRPTSTSSSSST